MGATDAAKTGQLLVQVATSIQRGQKKSFVEGLVAAKEVMRPGPKLAVTSRNGRKYYPKPRFDDPRWGAAKIFSKITYKPHGPAFWTEFGTRSHWIIPNAVGRSRTTSRRRGVTFENRRELAGLVDGKQALKFGGRHAAWAFTKGVRARPFWKKTKRLVRAVTADTVAGSIKRNIILSGFGR